MSTLKTRSVVKSDETIPSKTANLCGSSFECYNWHHMFTTTTTTTIL